MDEALTDQELDTEFQESHAIVRGGGLSERAMIQHLAAMLDIINVKLDRLRRNDPIAKKATE